MNSLSLVKGKNIFKYTPIIIRRMLLSTVPNPNQITDKNKHKEEEYVKRLEKEMNEKMKKLKELAITNDKNNVKIEKLKEKLDVKDD